MSSMRIWATVLVLGCAACVDVEAGGGRAGSGQRVTAGGGEGFSPVGFGTPYVSLRGGVGFLGSYGGSLRMFESSTDPGIDSRVRFRSMAGFSGEMALGTDFGGKQLEMAFGYGSNDITRQTMTVPGYGSASVGHSGSIQVFTMMLNGTVDIDLQPLGLDLPVKPYVGAGLGWASVSTPGCGFGDCFSGGSATGFAYQLKSGVGYPVGDGTLFFEAGYLGVTAVTVDEVGYDGLRSWRVSFGWRRSF
jgi:hypothetical protein